MDKIPNLNLALIVIGGYILYRTLTSAPEPGSPLDAAGQVVKSTVQLFTPAAPGVDTQSVPSVAKDWFWGRPGTMEALEDYGPGGIKGQR